MVNDVYHGGKMFKMYLYVRVKDGYTIDGNRGFNLTYAKFIFYCLYIRLRADVP